MQLSPDKEEKSKNTKTGCIGCLAILIAPLIIYLAIGAIRDLKNDQQMRRYRKMVENTSPPPDAEVEKKDKPAINETGKPLMQIPSGEIYKHSPDDDHYNSRDDQTKARLTVRYFLRTMKNRDVTAALKYIDTQSIHSKNKAQLIDFAPSGFQPVDLGSRFGDGYAFRFNVQAINNIGSEVRMQITYYVHKAYGDWRIYDVEIL